MGRTHGYFGRKFPWPDRLFSFINQPKEVIYCRAEGKHSFIFLPDGNSYEIPMILKDIHSSLNHSAIIRCHKSYLVNIHCVREVIGNYEQLRLNNDVKIPVSTRRSFYVKQQLEHLR